MGQANQDDELLKDIDDKNDHNPTSKMEKNILYKKSRVKP